MSEQVAAEMFHPGVFLEEMLGDDASMWGALIDAGLSVAYIERLRDGNARITQSTAMKIANATGTTAVLWMNLQDQFDRWQERTT